MGPVSDNRDNPEEQGFPGKLHNADKHYSGLVGIVGRV